MVGLFPMHGQQLIGDGAIRGFWLPRASIRAAGWIRQMRRWQITWYRKECRSILLPVQLILK